MTRAEAYDTALLLLAKPGLCQGEVALLIEAHETLEPSNWIYDRTLARTILLTYPDLYSHIPVAANQNRRQA